MTRLENALQKLDYAWRAVSDAQVSLDRDDYEEADTARDIAHNIYILILELQEKLEEAKE